MAGVNAGRRGQRWERLKADLRSKRRPCCICGQPIDYTLKWPDTQSFSVEHLKAWATDAAGREDPANLDAAHLGCNSSKQAGDGPQLGEMSEAW